MKWFCGIYVLFVVVLTVAATAAEDSEVDDLAKFYMEQATLYQKELNASDIDMEELFGPNDPKTKLAKCLSACLMNKLGVMDDANKLVPDKLEKIVALDPAKTKDGKTLKSMIKDMNETCKAVSDKDKCESAAKILLCLNGEAKKRGFDNNVI